MNFLKAKWFLISLSIFIFLVVIYLAIKMSKKQTIANNKPVEPTTAVIVQEFWQATDINSLPDNEEGKKIKYGRELIANTAAYLGPHGSVSHMSNGMNCQNCHLDAGTRPWGNNYGAVHSTYPKFRERSGSIES